MKDGDLQDAESYFDVIKVTLERENCTSLCTDDPRGMKSCRKMVEEAYPRVIVGPCHWHNIDNWVPLKVPTMVGGTSRHTDGL